MFAVAAAMYVDLVFCHDVLHALSPALSESVGIRYFNM